MGIKHTLAYCIFARSLSILSMAFMGEMGGALYRNELCVLSLPNCHFSHVFSNLSGLGKVHDVYGIYAYWPRGEMKGNIYELMVGE